MCNLPVLKAWHLHQSKPNMSVSDIRLWITHLELQVYGIREGFPNKKMSSWNCKQFSLATVGFKVGTGGGSEMTQARRRAATSYKASEAT